MADKEINVNNLNLDAILSESAVAVSSSINALIPFARVSFALRRVPERCFARLLPVPSCPKPGDVALARLEKVGKNTNLELANGRRCSLHEGDVLAVAFGNRYATEQFEGYAGADGDRCDLLSMGGLCGLIRSKHANVSEPTKLRLLGAIGDTHGNPLNLSQFALKSLAVVGRHPRVLVVCGTSMDAGKTFTAMSLIVGLKRLGKRVAAMKLTGTVCGRDTWSMKDAGAWPVLDFVDGGYPSTFECSLEQLLGLYDLLRSHAGAQGADWIVVEVADGLLQQQQETSALLKSHSFASTVDAWVFAMSDPVAALGGVGLLRDWGIEPAAISGLISLSPLAMREAEVATGVRCYTAKELQQGDLNDLLRIENLTVLSPPFCDEEPQFSGLEETWDPCAAKDVIHSRELLKVS